MKIIDRYILKKFLTTFFFCVLLLTLVIVIIDFTEKIDKFNRAGVSNQEILSYYASFIPFLAGLLTPITTFIAVVFITAKLAAQTEIIAILAGGVSFRRLMWPYFLGAAVIGALSFYLNGWVIPDANKFRVNFEVVHLKKPFYFNDTDIHFKVGENQYAYLFRYNNRIDRGYKFTLEEFEGNRLRKKLIANTIAWDTTDLKWTLQNWQLRTFNGFEEQVEEGVGMDTTLNIHPTDFDSDYGLETSMTIDELNSKIDLLNSRGADDVDIYTIEKYIRYMTPWTTLILTFIGLIVSARKSRGGTGFQIALGFSIAFLFIIFFIFSKALAEKSSADPLIAIWFPNIFFTLVGVLLYKTIPR
ncbi:MAG: LptF/LptG family permease [Cyclobacteriaceae bacterium]